MANSFCDYRFWAFICFAAYSGPISAEMFEARVAELWEIYPSDEVELAFYAASESALLMGSALSSAHHFSLLSEEGQKLVLDASASQVVALEDAFNRQQKAVLAVCRDASLIGEDRILLMQAALSTSYRAGVLRYSNLANSLSDADRKVWKSSILPLFGGLPLIPPLMRHEIFETLVAEFPSVFEPYTDEVCSRVASFSGQFELVREVSSVDGVVSETLSFQRIQ